MFCCEIDRIIYSKIFVFVLIVNPNLAIIILYLKREELAINLVTDIWILKKLLFVNDIFFLIKFRQKLYKQTDIGIIYV